SPSRPPTYLGKQRKCSLISTEIGIVNQSVGVDDANYTHFSEIQSLCHHLRTHQHIIPLFIKGGQHPFKAVFTFSVVKIETTDAGIWQQRLQFFLYPLCTEALAFDVG